MLGQRTIGGALVSQAVLDEGVMEYFTPAGNIQLDYGSVPLAPIMFQDDLLNGAESLAHAREANIKVDTIMKEQGLNLNKDKPICFIIGDENQKIEADGADDDDGNMNRVI